MTSRYLFDLFYLGRGYTGFQRQPNGMGIENWIELAFIKGGYITSFSENHYQSISRTDAGVSALCNRFLINLNHHPNLSRINSYLPKDHSIILTGFTQVNEAFGPKHVVNKKYFYFVPKPSDQVIKSIHRINQFTGTHNFTNFMKPDGAGSDKPISTILEINIQENTQGLWITFIGDKFGREQIRKIVGFLLDENHFSTPILEALETDRNTLKIASAPPQYLCLLEINFEPIVTTESTEMKLKHKFTNLQTSKGSRFYQSMFESYIIQELKDHS